MLREGPPDTTSYNTRGRSIVAIESANSSTCAAGSRAVGVLDAARAALVVTEQIYEQSGYHVGR